MGKARTIALSTRSFDKAGDATAFFTAMLNRYGIGDRVSAEDATDLAALLDRHEEVEEKAGTGISGFEVNTPPQDVPQFSKRCFWVVRNDGTKMTFPLATVSNQDRTTDPAVFACDGASGNSAQTAAGAVQANSAGAN